MFLIANIKSILNSVVVRYGCVRFPSRYAARETMDFLVSVWSDCSAWADYRILSLADGVHYVVFFPSFGALLDDTDLAGLLEELEK